MMHSAFLAGTFDSIHSFQGFINSTQETDKPQVSRSALMVKLTCLAKVFLFARGLMPQAPVL